MLLIVLSVFFASTCALSENGYCNIQYAITQSIGEGTILDLRDFTKEELPNEKTVTLLFYPWKNEVTLWGKNAENQSEVTLWNTELCTLLFGGYCGSWNALVDSLDEGYALNMILQAEEEADYLLIDHEEKAEVMHQAILSAME